jgi:hypothetical protein
MGVKFKIKAGSTEIRHFVQNTYKMKITILAEGDT